MVKYTEMTDVHLTPLHSNKSYRGVMPSDYASRSKAWVCDRSLAGIAGSNPAKGWRSVC